MDNRGYSCGGVGVGILRGNRREGVHGWITACYTPVCSGSGKINSGYNL